MIMQFHQVVIDNVVTISLAFSFSLSVFLLSLCPMKHFEIQTLKYVVGVVETGDAGDRFVDLERTYAL